MKCNNFKYLLSLILILGLFLTSCTDESNPLEDNLETADAIKKVEFMPSIAQVKTQTEAVLEGLMKSLIGSRIATNMMQDRLAHPSSAKSHSDPSYIYLNDWHQWTADMFVPFEGFDDIYHLNYLSQVQFRDNSYTPQVLAAAANHMLVNYNSHGRLGFINDDPRGDDVHYNYQGGFTPLEGNPSVANIFGNYERRWIGDYSEDGENWELIELYYNVEFVFNSLEFFYLGSKNDFNLNGNMSFYVGGYKVLANFTNSRNALLEVFGGTSMETLLGTYSYELPNYYQQMNVPSFENWDYNLTFAFPTPVIIN